MARWTKKSAIAHMQANKELEHICEEFPLVRVLIQSASKLRRYQGYNRIACHYAYKEWLRAIWQHENKMMYDCLHIIDDLLPPDATDIGLDGGMVFPMGTPRLPLLPLCLRGCLKW